MVGNRALSARVLMLTRLMTTSASITDVDCVRAIPERLERRCDIVTSPDFECSHLISESSGRRLSVAHFQHHGVIPNICQDCQSAKAGYDLAQNFDPLSSKVSGLVRQAGDVASRSRQGLDETVGNGVPDRHEHDRNG